MFKIYDVYFMQNLPEIEFLKKYYNLIRGDWMMSPLDHVYI